MELELPVTQYRYIRTQSNFRCAYVNDVGIDTFLNKRANIKAHFVVHA